MSALQFFLFGAVRIVHAERPTSEHVPHTVQALLAYLLLQRCRSHHRELLADLFWGDYCQTRARRCLNTALWRLRQVLEPAGVPRGAYLLTSCADEVGFNTESDYWLDVALFEEHARRALARPIEQMSAIDAQQFEEALQLYTGDLLEGFYDDWVLRERERLRRIHLNSVAYLMRYYEHAEAFEQALACGRQILERDPLREEIHRALMNLYCRAGQRPLAVQQYECCCRILATELNIVPMPETQALYTQIVQISEPAPALPPPLEQAVGYKQVLHQLLLARQAFEDSREQLQRAIQIAEQLAQPPEG